MPGAFVDDDLSEFFAVDEFASTAQWDGPQGPISFPVLLDVETENVLDDLRSNERIVSFQITDDTGEIRGGEQHELLIDGARYLVNDSWHSDDGKLGHARIEVVA